MRAGLRLLVRWAVALSAWGVGAVCLAAPPMAAGLLVKMKERATAQAVDARSSVVMLMPSRLPLEGSAAQARRVSALLSRQGVAHVGQRGTAFAAQAVRFDRLRPRAEAEAQAAQLRQHPDVEWVMVDEMLAPHAVPAVTAVTVQAGDPDHSRQAWLQSRLALPERAGLADVPAAWSRLQGLSLTPVTVAVLDSGILPAPDLQGRMWPGYDFVSNASLARDDGGLDPDPTDEGNWLTAEERDRIGSNAECTVVVKSDWHGLSVSYLLAAATDNGLQGAGILAPLPGPVVLPVRVAGGCGAAMSDLVEGMLWSAGIAYQDSPPANPHPARVINISFGGAGSCTELGPGTAGWLFTQTIDALEAKGVLVVASAGNGDASGSGVAESTRPANCPKVLATTGLNMRGYKASYANFVLHDGVSRFALAVASGDRVRSGSNDWVLSDAGILSLTNSGTRAPLSGAGAFSLTPNLVGTSFAAPQVAGVAALMLAASPSLTASQLRDGLTGVAQVRPFPVASTPQGATPQVCDAATGRTTTCNCTTATCGAGVLDAGLAVDWAVRHADQAGPEAGNPGDVQVPPASYFAPDRVSSQTTVKPASSGGGAADLLLLSGLLAMVVVALGLARARTRG
jgi:serine protease